jgi:rare lipoprotein A
VSALAGCAEQHAARPVTPAFADWTTTTARPQPAPVAMPAPHRGRQEATAPAAVPIRTASLTPAAPAPALPSLTGAHALEGLASFYWQEQKTATGEQFDKRAMTAAHRTLPFGTRVKVTNRNNGRSVVVRINDRGPFKPGRVIDLSLAAAEAIDMTSKGLVPVRVEVVR